MQLSTRQTGNVSVIDISSKVTAAHNMSLRDAIDRLYGSGKQQIVLNAAGVEYLHSSDLGEIVFSQARAKRTGVPLKLANVPRRMQDLLRMTRLISEFEIYDTLDAAVESFNIQPG